MASGVCSSRALLVALILLTRLSICFLDLGDVFMKSLGEDGVTIFAGLAVDESETGLTISIVFELWNVVRSIWTSNCCLWLFWCCRLFASVSFVWARAVSFDFWSKFAGFFLVGWIVFFGGEMFFRLRSVRCFWTLVVFLKMFVFVVVLFGGLVLLRVLLVMGFDVLC